MRYPLRAPTRRTFDLTLGDWADVARSAARAPDTVRALALAQIRLDLLAGELEAAGRGAEAARLSGLIRAAGVAVPAAGASRPGAAARVAFEESIEARRARRRGRDDLLHDDPLLWTRDLANRIRAGGAPAARIQGWSSRHTASFDLPAGQFAQWQRAASRSRDAVRAQALAQVRLATLGAALGAQGRNDAEGLDRLTQATGLSLPAPVRRRPGHLLAVADAAGRAARLAFRWGRAHPALADPRVWAETLPFRPEPDADATSLSDMPAAIVAPAASPSEAPAAIVAPMDPAPAAPIEPVETDRAAPVVRLAKHRNTSFDIDPGRFAEWHRSALRSPDAVRSQAAVQVRLAALSEALRGESRAEEARLGRLLSATDLAIPEAMRPLPGQTLALAKASSELARRARRLGRSHAILDDPRLWIEAAEPPSAVLDRQPRTEGWAVRYDVTLDVGPASFAAWTQMASRLPSAARAEALALIRVGILDRAMRSAGFGEAAQLERLATATDLALPEAVRGRPGAMLLLAASAVDRIEATGLSFHRWLAAIPADELARALDVARSAQMRVERPQRPRIATTDQSYHADHLRRLLRSGATGEAAALLEAKRGVLTTQPALRTVTATLAARLTGETDPLGAPEVNRARMLRDLARRLDARLFDESGATSGAHHLAADIRAAADAFLAACDAPARWRAVVAHLPIENLLPGVGRGPAAEAARGFISAATVKRARRSIEWFRAGARIPAVDPAPRVGPGSRGGPALLDSHGLPAVEPLLTDRGDPAIAWAALLARQVIRRTGLLSMRGRVPASVHAVFLDDLPLWIAIADAVVAARPPAARANTGVGWLDRALAEAAPADRPRLVTLVVGSDRIETQRLAELAGGRDPVAPFALDSGPLEAPDGVGRTLARLIREARFVVTDVPGTALSTALQERPTLLVTASPRKAMRMPDLACLRVAVMTPDATPEARRAFGRELDLLLRERSGQDVAA